MKNCPSARRRLPIALSFLTLLFLAVPVLVLPALAAAGQAWELIKYHATANTVLNDTFAFERSDPYQPTAGADDPYPYCYPMWRNTLTLGIPA